ncbi:MAG: TolC family protein [Candidatus Sumerlaeia bacterium]|nr:TolC family protein [Candidatus Sumerlaeia bacterium]
MKKLIESKAKLLVCSATVILATGCISYKASPLAMEGHKNAMTSRTVSEANVQTTTLSMADAERVALYLNPELRAARQAANIEAVAVNSAGLWEDPIASGHVLRLLESRTDRWVIGAGLMFTIPISGRLNVAKEMARASSQAAIVEAWGEEQRVIRELRDAWIDWDTVRESRVVNSNERARYESAAASGESTMINHTHTRVRLEDSQLHAQESTARLRILSLMGLAHASQEIRLVPGLTVPEWRGTPDDIFRANPRVLLRQAEYEVAEQSLRLEVRKQYPDLTIGPLFESRDREDRLGIGISLPIPILNGNRGNIANAVAVRDAACVAWQAAVEQAFDQYAITVNKRDMTRGVADSYRSLVPTARSQADQTRSRLDSDDRNTLLLVDSVGNERHAQLGLINSETALARENAALWALIPFEAPVIYQRSTEN